MSASGTGGQIALLRTDSLYLSRVGSEVGWIWTNFVSEGVEHTLNELEEGAITGYKDAPPSHKGTDFGQGDIQLEPNPNALGAFMRGVFGQASGSLLMEAGSWGANSGNLLNLPVGYGTDPRPVMRHLFVPKQSEWDPITYLPPYSMMIYKDVGSAFAFQGTIFNKVTFNIQAGQLVKSTVTAMARKVERFARSTSMAALRNPGGRPWVWDMASVQLGPGVSSLAAMPNYESLSVSLEIPIEGVVLLDGNKNYAEYQINGFRRVAIQGSMSFRNQDEYNAFTAYENRYLRFNLLNVNTALLLGNPASAYYFGLQCDIPNMKYLSWSAPIGGPNRMVAQFTAKAEFDTTSLYMIQMQLTNTTSAY